MCILFGALESQTYITVAVTPSRDRGQAKPSRIGHGRVGAFTRPLRQHHHHRDRHPRHRNTAGGRQSMVALKITGFGYTWIEGDFTGCGLAAVAGSIIAALLLPMLLLRLFGKWQYTGITANGGIADDRDQ